MGGYTWMYDANTLAVLSGYPKRTAEVFYGATGEVDAAFDTGKYVVLIIKGKVLIYEWDNILYKRQTGTLLSIFRISLKSQRIKSAFNHYKGPCRSNREICVKTTLIVSPDKHFEITWTRKGRQVQNARAGNGIDVIGERMAENQFQAAFEYTRSRSGGEDQKEVMIFDKGKVAKSREYYPGSDYKARVGWFVTPDIFSIHGWCNA